MEASSSGCWLRFSRGVINFDYAASPVPGWTRWQRGERKIVERGEEDGVAGSLVAASLVTGIIRINGKKISKRVT